LELIVLSIPTTNDPHEKVVFSLRDEHFAHCESAGGPFAFPDLPFGWDRSASRQHRLTVYTDNSLTEATNQTSGAKAAWLVESPLATAAAYRWIRRNAQLFDLVLTFDQELLETLPNARPVLLGGCWIKEHDRKIHEKSRNVSIIASAKKNMAGQKLRHKIIRKYGDRIDAIVGSGYKALEDKVEGLAPFRYSIVVENCRRNYYFSEKLIDCFMTGTVPIYWGCPSIGLFFDRTGIMAFQTVSELKNILNRIGPEDYERRMSAIARNFETAKRFTYAEYGLWEAVQDFVQ
jgi:hypothetical protein